MSQAGIAGNGGGGGGGNVTIAGNLGTPSTGDTFVFNAIEGSTSTLRFSVSGNTISLTQEDGQGNLIIGNNSGGGTGITSGNTNTGYGAVFNSLTSGSGNIALGNGVLTNLSTGNTNVGVGDGALFDLVSGSSNVALGDDAGSNYTSESNNIVFSNVGTPGDSGVIRLGGVHQTEAFIAGITGVTVAASSPAAVDASGQLSDLGFGTANQVLTSNGAGASPTWQPSAGNPASSSNASVSLATSIDNVTGDGTFYGPILFDTVEFDLGSNYNPATGLFTCPTTGQYLVCATVTFNGLTAANTLGNLIVTAGGFTFSQSAFNPGVVQSGGLYSFSYSIVLQANAGDTIEIDMMASGGTRIVGVEGANFGNYSYASFTLLST